ncbi:hypothetical protein GCM10027059_32820 [Myceligenerans halotolerans]
MGGVRAEYEEFCRRYGRDIREWSSYEWLRDVRELRMITTNARKSPPGSPAAAEVRRRLDSLRKGETSVWGESETIPRTSDAVAAPFVAGAGGVAP